MSLVAAHCRVCDHYWLVARVDIDSMGSAACECGSVGQALPSEAYLSGDVSLFDAIVASLEAAEVPPLQAGRLSLELELCEGLPPVAKLARLSTLVPSLAVIELIATADVATTRKAVGMLALLLEAMATSNRKSDISALLSASASASTLRQGKQS